MPTSTRQSDERPKDSAYQVVARRFRPKTFAEVVGQEAILDSLRSGLEQGRIPHALLFSGSRGVGKTTMARILARCLNCERGPTADPCGECSLCRSILDGSNTDVVEIDAASNNGVDDVRAMREHVGVAAMRSRYRVFILDEAHMLSKAAFNALLKTLEEPPPRVVFVLATTELPKIPETIRSRCQVLHFRRLKEEDIAERLSMIAKQEGVELEREVLEEIAASSRGGMRDSETLLERILPVAKERKTPFDLAAFRALVRRVGADRALDVAADLLAGNAAAAMVFAREIHESGVDEREALSDVIEQLRLVLLLRIGGPDTDLVAVSDARRRRLADLASSADDLRLQAMIQAGLIGRDRLRRFEDQAVVLELTLLRMAQAGSLPTLGELVSRVESLARNASPAPLAAPRAPGHSRAAPPSSLPMDLRSLLLRRLKASSPMLLGTVELCALEGPDAEGRVVLSIESEARMDRDRMSSPDVQRDLTRMLRELSDRVRHVEFRVGEPGGRAAEPGPPAALGERTRAVVDRLGGQVVAVNPQDRPSAARRESPDEDFDREESGDDARDSEP
ncbi:MAG: hypothetical protein Fur0037_16540 [Planctomycetota bacterium]